jgi:hypothetical protein
MRDQLATITVFTKVRSKKELKKKFRSKILAFQTTKFNPVGLMSVTKYITLKQSNRIGRFNCQKEVSIETRNSKQNIK